MDGNGHIQGSILLVEHGSDLRDAMGEYLRAHGFDVQGVENAGEGLRRLREIRPFVVFLDGAVSEEDATELLQALSKESPDTPVVIVPENGDAPAAFGTMDLDAYEILPRPITPAGVEHAVRHARFTLGLSEAARAHLRYLERRNVQLDLRLHELEKFSADLQRESVHRAKDKKALRDVQRDHEETEFRLRTIRAAFDSAGDAILISDTEARPIYANAAFEATFGPLAEGADVYDLGPLFVNPGVPGTINENVGVLGTFSCEVEMITGGGQEFPALVRASTIADADVGEMGRLFIFTDITEQESLRKQAHHDVLTGLYSRRYFMEQLTQSMSLARRHGHPLSFCVCDLDKFKQVNDTYGHVKGDEVLESFARIVSDEIRTEDIAGRIGGDEFCLIFSYVKADVAVICIERIRRKFESLEFAVDNGEPFSVTATFGIADMEPTDLEREQLIELADQSLYAAKEFGRNCVAANGKKMD